MKWLWRWRASMRERARALFFRARTESELQEDSQEAPRQRGGPRLRPLAPEHRLAGFPAGRPQRAQCAVDRGQRVAQSEVPLMYVHREF